MKTLILVRHAKSSWGDLHEADIDRPLNERGKKDAPEMAVRLKEKGIRPDLLLSSTARRARKTAKYFAEVFKKEKEDIELSEPLYLAAPGAIETVVAALSDKHDTVALFGHNPGITEFANTLTNVRIDDMPTCALFAVQAATDHWDGFKEAAKSFLFFDYPKNPLG